MTIQTILQAYDVHLNHVYHVSNLALTMFDTMKPVHNLPRRARHLLEVGALLHDVGMSTNPEQHHLVGRDIVLDVDFPGLNDDARAIVACLVAFHRKKVRPNHEPTYLRLSKKQRDIALRLAALLRVADGLDYSHTQSTHISDCKVSGKQVLLRLKGPHTHEDVARAAKKADLWNKVLGSEVTIISDEEPMSYAEQGDGDTPISTAESEVAALKALDDPVVVLQPASLIRRPTSHDPLAALCLRMLRQTFRDLLSRERGVYEDRDAEDVHKMRVATRRLRALMPIVGEVAPPKQVRRSRRPLKDLARALGSVRDCDVFLEHIHTAMRDLPEDQRDGLSPLVMSLQRDRAMGRENLVDLLDHEEYATFKHHFAAFMTDRPEDWDTSLRVRDRIGSITWQRYEALRSYESVINARGTIDDTDELLLHDARIAGKRLRYVLDLFANVIGERSERLTPPLARLQECLGTIQDVATARSYIISLNLDNNRGDVIEHYLMGRLTHRSALMTELPNIWGQVFGSPYRRDLIDVIADL